MKVSKNDVWEIVKRCFPDYRGRKFRVEICDAVSFYDVNWGGGSRNYYRALDLSQGQSIGLPNNPPWCNPAEGATVSLPVGSIVVKHSIFCGKDTGITIYVNPANVATLLPQPVA